MFIIKKLLSTKAVNMKSHTNTLAALSIVGLLVATPVTASCLDEVTKLNGSINSALIVATDENRQAAKLETDAADALCTNGDENGAAVHIANAQALLGILP